MRQKMQQKLSAQEEAKTNAGQISQAELMAQRKKRMAESEEMMMYFIAQYEAFRSVPYQLPGENFRTYNFGNTVTPEGKPVKATDRVHSLEEAIKIFSAHLNTVKNEGGKGLTMAEAMEQFLPLEKMTDQEIAIMGSLCWNCGHGILYKKNGNGERVPSAFAQCATEYFTTRTDEAQQTFFEKFYAFHNVKRNGKVVPHQGLIQRRNREIELMRGDKVYMTLDDETPIPEGTERVNIRKLTLGAINLKSLDDVVSCSDPNSPYYRYHCSGDSIETAVRKDLACPVIQKAKSTPKQKNQYTRYARRSGRGR